MKKTMQIGVVIGCLLGILDTRLFAQLNIPSDGSDGALNITTNTVIDLSQATYGVWSQNNSTNAGNGVYDGTHWAVVFKYSSVNIGSNATVTFLNYPTHAPVVWLVQGNVTISGNLSLDGSYSQTNYPNYLIPTEPGPGGFRGGAFGPSGLGAGYGPGGAQGSQETSIGSDYGNGYGNPQALPLVGGSGAGGLDSIGDVSSYGITSGSSGGGAILIAVGGTALISGNITARGNGYNFSGIDGPTDLSGGGAIRIIANSLQGNGSLIAGLVRTEVNSISQNLIIMPNTVAVPPGTTPVIWPTNTAPVVTIVNINSAATPIEPVGGVGTTSDVNISTTNAVSIVLQSQNFPPNGTIVVRVTPKYANYFNVNAVYQSGTFSNATWVATTVLSNGFCVLQAHATSQ